MEKGQPALYSQVVKMGGSAHFTNESQRISHKKNNGSLRLIIFARKLTSLPFKKLLE